MINKQLKLIFISLVLSVFFLGCSSKSALSVFGDDILYERGLEYTQVDDIINSFETKAIINATYLNSTDPKKWDNKYQNFLVGIYIVNDNDKKENQFLNNKKYILTLNDQNISKSYELKSTNYLWDHIPVKNPHAKYYIVSFKKDNSKELKLMYKNATYKPVILSFVAE